jgi:xanthine/uracil permease
MKDQRPRAPASVDNIYKLDGRVPVGKAIPFGLQHVLAMFVANVTPVMMTLASRDYGLMIGATSFAIGIGVTQVPEFFSGMPKIVSDIFAGNPVAGVFVISMILSLTLPKKVKMEDVGALTEDTIDSKKPE